MEYLYIPGTTRMEKIFFNLLIEQEYFHGGWLPAYSTGDGTNVVPTTKATAITTAEELLVCH